MNTSTITNISFAPEFIQILQNKKENEKNNNNINLSLLEQSTDDKIYAPINILEEVEDTKLSIKHAAEPFKNLRDINRITNYLLSKGKYRDYMLFVVGINFGLRASDLLKLKFKDILNNDSSFKTSFELIEKKTSKTRTHKKARYIKIGKAVQQAVITYLQHNPEITLNDYLFTSQKKDDNGNSRPITRQQMERILKSTAKELNIKGNHFSTHSLRKTFGYHMMKQHNNDPRTLLILQQILGHSTSAITLNYIGITQDEIDSAYDSLNLGLREKVLDSDIFEN